MASYIDSAQDVVEVRDTAIALLDKIKQGHSHVHSFIETLKQHKDIFDCLFPEIEGFDSLLPEIEGANVEVIEDVSREFLPAACLTGDLQTVELLLSLGADVTKPGKEGNALDIATVGDYKDIVDKCISSNPDIVKDPVLVKACLFKACHEGHKDLMLTWLGHLKAIPDWSSVKFTADNDPLIAVCNGGHLNLIEELMKHGLFIINEEILLKVGRSIPRILHMWIKQDEQNNLTACWHNKYISHFEPTWLHLPNNAAAITTIDLSNNDLQTLPELLVWGLPGLISLNLSHNNLSSLPSPTTLQQINNSSLTDLDISHNQLKVISAEILWLDKLEDIDISHNLLQGFKPLNLAIGSPNTDSSRNLKKLVLSNNHFTDFPDAVVQAAEKLKTLYVSHNRLQTIPSELRCEHMVNVVLSHNSIGEFPRVMTTAKNLRMLNLSDNQLKECPPFWDCPLRDLQLYNNEISDVPDDHPLWRNTLESLNMGKNRLEEMPLAVCRLMSLKCLTLKENSIDKLPPALEWNMYKLKYLDLSNNLLSHESLESYERRSSTSHGWFQRRLSKTHGENITVTLTETAFPQNVCASLTSLKLSNNPLMDLPMSVCDMRRLQTLQLNNIPTLDRLPLKLAKLDNLYFLSLHGTNISDPPEIQKLPDEDRNASNIKKVLWNRLHDCVTSRDMKLIIVGPEKSGKTQLLTRLTDTAWPVDDKGVNVHKWSLSSNEKQKKSKHKDHIQFTVWDLKGKDSYATIYQPMLTPNALYLLVWDLQTGQGPEQMNRHTLRQWVLSIKSRFRNHESGAFIVVGTHLDKVRRKPAAARRDDIRNNMGYYSRQMIGKTFPEFYDYMIDVDAETDDGLTSMSMLKRLIFHTASNMRYRVRNTDPQPGELFIGRKVPRAHLILKDRIAERIQDDDMNLPIMTEVELLRIVGTIPSNRIETPTNINEAVDFLQDCGSVMCVNDHTYRLTRLYFLDPSWLFDALNDVISLQGSNGIVPTAHLKDLGELYGFSGERFEDYLKLLARFEIALPYPDGRRLIPSQLASTLGMNEDNASSIFRHKLYRWYKLPDIPAGFWSRLVSRLTVGIRRVDEESHAEEYPSSLPSHGRLELNHAHVAVSQHDVFIRHDDGEIRVEPMQFPDDESGIRVTVRCRNGTFRPIGFVVAHIENLIDDWYPALKDNDSLQCLVPCSVCINKTPTYDVTSEASDLNKYHVFPLKELAVAATIRKLTCVRCYLHPDITVPLTELVPDLFLVDLDIHHIDEKELQLHDKVGQGGYGEVLMADYRGEQVAVKRFLKRRTSQRYQYSDITEEEVIAVLHSFPKLRIEIDMMSRLRHPFILRLIGVSIQTLSFAMEYAPKGDLYSEITRHYHLRKPDFFSSKMVHGTLFQKAITYKICLQLVSALEYIHSKKVIHTDIKSNNILSYSLDPEDQVNVKLADYGISRDLDEAGVKGQSGLHPFVAPEIIEGKSFDEKVDLYSFGMLIYHIMRGVGPFADTNDCVQVRQILSSGQRPQFDNHHYKMIPHFDFLRAVMEACWQDKPHTRPSATDILNVMRDPSFLCLEDVIDLEVRTEGCIYANSLQTAQYPHVIQWQGDKDQRNVTEINVLSITETTISRPGHRVTCAMAFGDMHIVGIMDDSACAWIHVHHYKPDGHIGQISHVAKRKVGAMVTSLCYSEANAEVSTASLPSTTRLGHLFVGQEDGTVTIFTPLSIQPTAGSSQSVLSLSHGPKVLTLGITPQSCTCMHLSDTSNSVIVGCGNRLMFIATKEPLLVDGERTITVTDSDDDVIEGISVRDDDVWCYLHGSSLILNYNTQTRQLVTTLQTNISIPQRYIYESTASQLATASPSVIDGANARSSIKVAAILVVDDTLWIGRSDGLVLVVNIGRDGSQGVIVGQLLAVLTDGSISKEISQSGTVRYLCRVGLDHVVAYRDKVGHESGQILVWRKWNTAQFQYFDNMHSSLPRHT